MNIEEILNRTNDLEIKNKIKEIIEFNKNKGYDTKWELACYCDNTRTYPDVICEYSIEETNGMNRHLGWSIIYDDFVKIEISLIGQDEDGNNETCFNLKTILIGK